MSWGYEPRIDALSSASTAVRVNRAPLPDVQRARDATVDQVQRLLRTSTLDEG